MLKKDLISKLKKLGLTKKEFASLVHIPYNTVNNWSDEKRPIPSWVEPWLENYIQMKELEQKIELSESEEMLQDLSRIEMMLNNKKFNLILKFIEDMKALDDEDK